MSKVRIERLNQYGKLKQAALDKAFQAYSNAKAQFERCKTQHEKLVLYREDYVRQINSVGEQGCTLGNLRNRIDFIGHVDVGLMQLNRQLSDLGRHRQFCEQQYIKAKAELEAVKKLIATLVLREQQAQARKEQKENDAFALKVWQNARSGDVSREE